MQKSYVSSAGRLESELSYWKHKLNEFEMLNLILDKPRPSQTSYVGNTVRFSLDAKTSDGLRKIVKNLDLSLYSVLLSGFNLFLGCYSNQDDIILGIPATSRPEQQPDGMVGFTNSLVLRSRIDSELILKDYVKLVANEMIEARLHQGLALEQLVAELNIQQDASRHPIFQVMFGMQNMDNGVGEGQVKILEQHSVDEKAKCDITVMLDDSQAELAGIFNYATSLFNEATIHNYIQTYKCILSQLAESATYTKQLKYIRYLDHKTYNDLINLWNQTDRSYPADKTVQQLFEEQVARTPANIALVYGETQLTYHELNQRANQLANYLSATYGIQGDDLVAVCMDRSELILIAILAILKSGAAYVPLDPGYPDERITYVLHDTKTKLILTNTIYDFRINTLLNKNRPTIGETAIESIDSSQMTKALKKYPKSNPETNIDSQNLAYVIYTSGTTGNPKGVMIEHDGVVNLAIQQATAFGLVSVVDSSCSQLNCLSYANFVFDAHVMELFTVICHGHVLHVLDETTRKNLDLLEQYIEFKAINLATIPPALLSVDNLFKLDTLVVGGDTTPLAVMQHYEQHGVQLINAYGPTEATVCATMHQYKTGDSNVNLGKPLLNVTAYILNQNLQILPVGAVGELYIGGVGLARGYLNQPLLTAEKFIANPFQSAKDKLQNKNGRIYKTGDLVRYLPDGNIEYLGRNDFQIKLRGFRIEPGEVESVISSYAGVKHAVVLAAGHKNQALQKTYLVAYYVAEKPLDESALRNCISTKIPEYMLPDIFCYLSSLPLTVNGKLDRKALPDPQLINTANYVAPRNDLQRRICTLYAKLFGLAADQIGIQDDFFKLGGSSILAIQGAHQLSSVASVRITVADIFRFRVIEELAHYIATVASENLVITKSEQVNKLPLSFAQERLWFLEQYEQGNSAYHIPLLMQLSTQVDIDSLIKALKAIVSRHHVLRSFFVLDESGVDFQEVQDNWLEIRQINCSTEAEHQHLLMQDINKPFNLRQEFPLRICIYHVRSATQHASEETTQRYLLINIHHIASDGWSIDILQKELLAYYDHYSMGNKVHLPELSIQYKDFAVWQRDYLSPDRLAKQLAYWRARLGGYETLNLPLDKPRPVHVDYSGSRIKFALSVELSSELRAIAQANGCTIYTLLLAGFYVLLNKYSNQTDIVVGTPSANRDYEQVKDLIGFFINMLVQREQLDLDQSILFLAQQIHQHLVEAQLHQDIPFEKLLQELNSDRDASRHPIFQVMFTVQSFGSKPSSKWNELFNNVTIENLHTVTRFDLECYIDDSQSALVGEIIYATSLYHHETIRRFIKHYELILSQLVAEAAQPLRDYRLLSQQEYQQSAIMSQQGKVELPRQYLDLCVHEIFIDQALRNPARIAVINGDLQLSYQELYIRSNKLARYLNRLGVKPNTLVAVVLDKGWQQVLACLAIMQAGAAYVPADTSWPKSRILEVLKQSQASVVIGHSGYPADDLKSSLVASSAYFLAVEDEELWSDEDPTHLAPQQSPDDLIYVLFTSGSTGKPKGAMLHHRGVVNSLIDLTYTYDFTLDTTTIAIASLSFDLSVFEMFGALTVGGKIVYPNKGQLKDPVHLLEQIDQHAVNTWFSVPALISLLIEFLVRLDEHIIQRISDKFKCILLSGDVFPIALARDLLRLFPNAKIINSGGATEVSVISAWYTIAHIDDAWRSLPYGHAMANQVLYVLDDTLNHAPVGIPGQLYIGGVGVGYGYWGDEERTKAQYLHHPGLDGVIFKTGDLVRWMPDGNLEYIGRNDFQVKIRGFRIELGEIENRLLSYPGIKQVVVTVNESEVDKNSRKYLVAYYTSEGACEHTLILEYLSRFLPEYMLPNAIMHLDELPLTANAKLNRAALPKPQFTSSVSYVAPRNELERRICLAYADVLGLPEESISIHDDFFMLGGNSILAIKLVYKINGILNSNLSLASLFKYKTIENITTNFGEFKEYTPIVLLNNYSNKKLNLFMIHPGHGGCDVYYSLADALDVKYNCFGVDNFNVHNTDKLTTIEEVAAKYLEHIKETQPAGEYNLLGWSLGGQIALQIAGMLELEGYSATVNLLDTYIPEDNLQIATPEYILNMQSFNLEIINMLLTKGISPNYIKKIELALPVEFDILNSGITLSLNVLTKIKLFKAMHETSLAMFPANNLSKYIHFPFEVIEVNSDHNQILDIIIGDQQLLSQL